jgi:hypothetical protein
MATPAAGVYLAFTIARIAALRDLGSDGQASITDCKAGSIGDCDGLRLEAVWSEVCALLCALFLPDAVFPVDFAGCSPPSPTRTIIGHIDLGVSDRRMFCAKAFLTQNTPSFARCSAAKSALRSKAAMLTKRLSTMRPVFVAEAHVVIRRIRIGGQ